MQGVNSCRLPLSMPPDPVDELADPGTQFSNWNPHVMSTTVWAFESFLQVCCPLLLPFQRPKWPLCLQLAALERWHKYQ